MRSDIYSLGALAFFLLAGKSPFTGRNALDMLIAHRSEPPPLISRFRGDVPQDLDRLIHRCLAKNPQARPPSAEALDDELAACESSGEWTDKDARQWWLKLSPTDGASPAASPTAASIPHDSLETKAAE